MKKRKSTFGLQLEQLADLFEVGAENPVPTEANHTGRELAQMLRTKLTEVLPGNVFSSSDSAKGSDNEQFELSSLVGESLLQVFLCPDTSISQLQVIKELSKQMTTKSISEAELAVATTIYYAAIASCLVHHRKKITQHSYEKLYESFALLIEKKWMVPKLIELFSRAQDICINKRVKK